MSIDAGYYDTSYPPSLWAPVEPLTFDADPDSVVAGGAVTFTIAGGVAPYHVTFGDGTAAVDTSATTVPHTFPSGTAPGSKTARVTDADGTQVTAAVTVTAAP